MLVEVDQLGSLGDGAKGGLGHPVRRPGEGDDRTIVVGIAVTVEGVDAGNSGDGGGDGVDNLGAPALREIRDALDQRLRHGNLEEGSAAL